MESQSGERTVPRPHGNSVLWGLGWKVLRPESTDRAGRMPQPWNLGSSLPVGLSVSHWASLGLSFPSVGWEC